LDRLVTSLLELVEERWASLMARHGFDVISSDMSSVVLDSHSVRVEVAHDPRGGVDVSVFPHGQGASGRWEYTGMVGRASVARLLDIAAEKMESEPAVLRGDGGFYATLADQQRAASSAWTAYYAGQGPRPGRPHLP
jgi:hypothetical protein